MNKFRHYKKHIKLSLFQAALIFSVLSFSGFNLQANTPLADSVNTELTESRTRNAVYKLKSNTKDYCKSPFFTSALSAVKSYNTSFALNHTKAEKAKFTSYQNRIFLYSRSSIKTLFKLLPSSSHEEPPLSM